MSSATQQEMMMKSKNFSQTCNLLSQYLKDNKGSFGTTAKNLSASSTPPTGVSSPLTFTYNREVKSMDLFPQRTGFGPSTTTPTATKKSETAQMTIFYGGKVLVFDDLSVEKAKEVLSFAKNVSTSAKSNSVVAKDVLPQRPQQTQQKAFADVPIARKASLHRFLEKRKDRINAKAPYQADSTKQDRINATSARLNQARLIKASHGSVWVPKLDNNGA